MIYQVPSELEAHVNRFIDEAALRGESISITNLIIRYSESLTPPTCGNCNTNKLTGNIQKIITISSTACWTNNQDLEALIFHELGHCVLGRLHLSDKLPNGDPKSLMIENDIRLYSPCEYQIGNEECDKTYRRNYYLDELFNESTPVPTWGE